MQWDEFIARGGEALPVILGTGLTGAAISRALSAAGVVHALVGEPPDEGPRLGESLNAEGSLEALRQFPDLARFFHEKRGQVLLFGEHAVAFDALHLGAGRVFHRWLGLPANVRLLHVDRRGLDRALFDTAVADVHCVSIAERVTDVEYRAVGDRVEAVRFADGRRLAASYLFDATNHLRVAARRIGVAYRRLGTARRVVFAHAFAPARPDPATGDQLPGPEAAGNRAGWRRATTLLRLDARTDRVDGLAWCIPLGDYVSVGISVDPEAVRAAPEALLDWVERAYAARGIDVRANFPRREAAVDFPYDHYYHERCHGRNWLLTGPTCCQFWFPSAAGVATGLVAARLAREVLRPSSGAAAWYQGYLDQVAATHGRLDWLVGEDPAALTSESLRHRAGALVGGNVRRLGDYVGLNPVPAELAGGDAFTGIFEHDRQQASPVRLVTAAGEALAGRIFLEPADGNPWLDRSAFGAGL